MRRRVLLVTVIAVLSGLLTAGPASAQGAPSPPPPQGPVYLALGDSVAAGVGASAPATTGYVPRLHARLRAALACPPRPDCDELALRNLAEGGAITATLIRGQLPAALAELRARNWDADPSNDVKVVTVTIGGNDAFAALPFCRDPANPAACRAAVRAVLTMFSANFTLILAKLRLAAGPLTPIVAMTYYNPLPFCDLDEFTALGDAVLEGGTPLVERGLNDRIRSISATWHVRVAETYGRLGRDELVGGRDCRHPNVDGHQVIADRFAAALGLGAAAA
jgi:lysophospholipase L1-like esterase